MQVNLPATTVGERGLVTQHPKWKDVVSNHLLYSRGHGDQISRQFQGGIVLGYVTPVSPLTPTFSS